MPTRGARWLRRRSAMWALVRIYENHDESDSQYTTVEEARHFVEETGVDSLAISIGTAHVCTRAFRKSILTA